MPNYKIQTPSGRTLTIEAADEASAIKGAQEWEAKNVRPKMDKVDMRPVTGADIKATFAPQRPKKSSAWDQIAAFSQAATEQIPFLDEAAAYTAAKLYGKSYEDMRKLQATLADEDRQERPLARNAGGVAGFTATVVAPAGGLTKVAQGKNLLTTTARTAALGAATGGVQGFASDDGSAAERVDGAVKGGLLGGAIGGAAPSVGAGLNTLGRAINGATGQRFVSPTASAAGRLRATLQQDGVPADKIDRAVREFEEVGIEAPTLLDVAGENTRGLVRYAASRTGAGRNSAQAYRDTVAEGLPDAARARAMKLTPGETRSAGQYATDLDEARDLAARTEYAGPYAQKVDVSREMASAIRGEAGQSAIRRARAAAAARRDYDQVAELDQLLIGDLDTFPSVSAGTIDRIRIAMGERARTAGQRGANDMASGLRSRAEDIDGALDNVDGLADARANYRGFSQAIEAVESIGPQILRSGPDEFAASVRNLDKQGRAAAQVGARQTLTDLMGQRANAAPALRQIAFAPNARKNLTSLFGPEEADRYVRAAKLQLRRLENANFVAPKSNSQTFGRQADADEFEGLADVLSVGRKEGAMSAILEKLSRGLTLTDREAEALVELGLMQPRKGLAAVRPTLSQRTTQAVTAPQLTVMAPSSLAAQGANRR